MPRLSKNATSSSFLAQYGQQLLDLGYPIIPIKKGFKHPRGMDDWQMVDADRQQLQKWLSNGFADGGVGVLTRNYPCVDLDVRDPAIVDQLIEWCEENIGGTVCRVGESPKTLLVYRTEKPFPKAASATYTDYLDLEHKVEVLGDGQQFVAYADHPDTGEPYQWTSDEELIDIAPADLPVITAEQARALVDYFEQIRPADWELKEKAPATSNVDLSLPEEERILAHAKPPVDIDHDGLAAVLGKLDPDMRMLDWCRVGMGLYHQYRGRAEGFALWDEWSSGGVKYNLKEMRSRWRSFEADLRRQNPVTAATILKMAKDAGWQKKPELFSDFKLLHAEDILAKLGPINWRIEGFLEENTTGLIFGDPGSYKSFLALDMAFHVAAGRDWHRHAVSQGPVIYIAGEGHGGLARRFAAWQRHHKVDLSTLPLYVSQQAARFYDKDSAKQVVKAVSEIAERIDAPALIVIDTLARNFGGGDENSNTDVGVFLNHVDGLLRARFGATVMIVHHTGHSNKERARGATALKGGMDFEYRVEKPEDDTGRYQARLVCTKMKDAREPADLWFEGQEVMVGAFDDDDMTSLVFETTSAPIREEPELKGKQAELYKTIKQEEPVGRDVLRGIVIDDGLFGGPEPFKRALQELKKKEMIMENDDYIITTDAFFS